MSHRAMAEATEYGDHGEGGPPPLSLAIRDLENVERAITLRLPNGHQEGRRADRMRALVRVTAELTRSLSTYSQHALVHCQGTAGTTDLSDDTRRLGAALEAFCHEIHAVADEYGAHLGGSVA